MTDRYHKDFNVHRILERGPQRAPLQAPSTVSVSC